jgi:sec-independent protein translocase protein TatA
MGGLSIWHWLIVIAVVLLLFGGRGRVSNLMGDLAKGVKAFKHGMKDDPADGSGPTPDSPPKSLSGDAAAAVAKERDEAAKH